MGLGADDYIKKPFTAAEVLSSVNMITGLSVQTNTFFLVETKYNTYLAII